MEYLKTGLCILLIVRVIGYMFDPKTYGDNSVLEFFHIIGAGLSLAALIMALSYLLTDNHHTYNLMCWITCLSLFILLLRKSLQ